MNEPPRRPILKLKSPPPAIPRPEAPVLPSKGETRIFARKREPVPVPPLAPPVQPAAAWKCRPCGMGFDVAEDMGDEDWVRCPKCNARLGRAGDFRAGRLEKLRARAAKRPD